MDQQVHAILVGMKEKLSEGWIQGATHTSRGVCLFGAGIVAGGGLPVRSRVALNLGHEPEIVWDYDSPASGSIFDALELIAKEVQVPYHKLAAWNDEPGRTVDEIVAVIDRLLLKDVEKPEREEKNENVEVLEMV